MKLRFVTLAVCCALPVLSAEISKVSAAGAVLYRLSNEYLELDVSPAEGGRIVRMFHKKTGRELTPRLSLSNSPGGTGLLNDRVINLNGGTCREYETGTYQVVSASQNKKAAVLVLKKDRFPLAVEKKIVLDDHVEKVQISYALSNPGNQDFCGRFWICNVISPDPKADHDIFLPDGRYNDPQGVPQANHVVHRHDPKASVNHFVYQPKQDYAAVAAKGIGAAVTVPFEYLDYFYSYAPASDSEPATLEWFTLPFRLKPLADGEKYAVNHPEAADPLADYVYRFAMTVEVIDANRFQYGKYRPLPTAGKTKRFEVGADESRMHTDFPDIALIDFKPWKKKPRVGVVANGPAVNELAELNRRLKMDMQIVEAGYPHVFSNRETAPYLAWRAPDAALALEKVLKSRPDMFLLSGTWQRSLPENLCKELIRQVQDGASLVYVSAQNFFPALISGKGNPLPRRVMRGIPWEQLPADTPAVREYSCGKGKVIHVPFKMYKRDLFWTQGSHAVTPVIGRETDLKYWEYYFSFYGRLFRYLAGTEPRVAIQSAVQEVDHAVLKVENGTKEKEFTVRITVDEPGNDHSVSEKIILKEGGNTVRVKLPQRVLPNEPCMFNILLDDAAETADWCSIVGKPMNPNCIAAVVTDKYAHAANETIRGRIRLSGRGDVRLRLRDFQGRVMAKQDWYKVSGDLSFALQSCFRSSVPLAYLTAELEENGKTVSRKTATLTLEPLPLPSLQFVLWNHGEDNWISRKIDTVLAELGFTVGTGSNMSIATDLEWKRGSESMMGAGMRIAPMSMHRICSHGGLKSLQRNPCLRDPAYFETIRKDVAGTVERSKAYYPARYYSGDENSLGYYSSFHDFCQSRWCLAAFRGAMREKYGSLQKLNAVWKTAFRNWEEVKPFTLQQSKDSGNYVPWYEHRLFMMGNVSGALAHIKQELVKASPGAKLGFSGQLITDIYGAFNWQEALKHVDYPTAYTRDVDGLPDLMRSFKQPEAAGSAWIGYGQMLSAIRFKFWQEIMSGMFSPAYWWCGYLSRRGDRRLSPEGEHIKATLAEIRRSGVDRMFADDRPVASPVSVVYSIPSLVSCGITGEKNFLNQQAYNGNFSGWTAIIRSMGFTFPRIITDEDLESITPESHPVVILPLTQVLSDRTAQALRRYVENGGFLIADSSCGMFNECGVRREDSPLAELFGIRTAPGVEANAGTVVIADAVLNVMPAADQIALTDGKAYGSIQGITRPTQFGKIKIAGKKKTLAPAAVVRNTGKGRTLYLNFLLNNYPDIFTKSSSSRPLVQAMKKIFADNGVTAPHDLSAGLTLTEYVSEGNRCLGLIRMGGDSDGKYTLRFDREYEIYDTINHKYLGRHKVYSGMIQEYDAQLFALLPEKLQTFAADVRFNGRTFTVRLDADDVNSVVRIEVLRDGREIRDLSGNWNLRNHREIELNGGLEPAGNWTFRIMNLFSGKTITRNIKIEGEN